MDDHERTRLSRAVAVALRHKPWLYELELNEEGWMSITHLVTALCKQAKWHGLTEADLAEMIAHQEKRRYEIRDGRIRAFYGHSVPGRIVKTPATPPELLYHGTTVEAARHIQASGLKPMNRQYVHLSTDWEIARLVARRKGSQTVILTVKAGEAYQNGIRFYHGNEMVWLADSIPSQFIVIPSLSEAV